MSDDLEQVANGVADLLDYKLGSEVGSGSFKRVWVAENDAGKRVAIKIAKSTIRSIREEREVEAMKRLSYSGISTLLDCGEYTLDESGYSYIIEEYLSGGSLQDRLDGGEFMSPPEATKFCLDILNSLDLLYENNLVHRDIKPANIMFRIPGGDAVLADFGIVRDLSADSLTQTWAGRGPGTPFFASPEQLNNEKASIDWRCDQFGLGVTISIAVFGMHPYAREGDAYPALAIDRVSNRLLPSSTFEEKCDSAQLSWLKKMVMPWPAERFRKPSLCMDALQI